MKFNTGEEIQLGDTVRVVDDVGMSQYITKGDTHAVGDLDGHLVYLEGVNQNDYSPVGFFAYRFTKVISKYPKIPNKPDCLSFRKTVVLNIDEVNLLKLIVADIHKQLTLSTAVLNVMAIPTLESIMEKLTAETPAK